jgi:ketosteroid isomerase-like protein
MADHPNLDLCRRGYQAFAEADMATLTELISPDATWHIPGTSPLSGDHTGHEQIFGFFGGLGERSEGTFALAIQDMLANDDRGVVIVHVTAGGSSGRTLDQREVHELQIENGQVVDFRAYPADLPAADAYWG